MLVLVKFTFCTYILPAMCSFTFLI